MLKTVLAVAVAVGCGGGGGSNDGVPPDGPTIGGTCSETNDQCSGETICVASSCVLAFPRAYNASNIRVTVPTTDPNGAGWDVGGGAPDLLVEVLVNGAKVATTPVVADMFSATFAGPFAVQLSGGANLEFIAYDEDVTTNDFAYGCVAKPITAAHLRSRRLMCATGGSTMMINVTPR